MTEYKYVIGEGEFTHEGASLVLPRRYTSTHVVRVTRAKPASDVNNAGGRCGVRFGRVAK